jgi:hypothetical protein
MGYNWVKGKMKKFFMFLGVTAIVALMSSCSTLGAGMVYEGITVPHSVTSNTISDNIKVGRSNHISVLGIVAVGDGGINAAAKNAGIKKISHVDEQKTSILGVYTKSETIVYGE